jgi:uncharacterized SAM-binding protein YcdF (DUF218 family)
MKKKSIATISKDAVIILSHRRENNDDLSEECKKRIEKGIKLVLFKKAKNIILCSEMATKSLKDYLEKKGIKKKNIFLQQKSKDTIGEAFFTKRDVLLPNNWKNIYVISSDYHIRYRATFIFDFVLGVNFNIDYLTIKSDKIKDINVFSDQIRSLYLFIKLIRGIDPGDDKFLKKRIFESHKLYKNI